LSPLKSGLVRGFSITDEEIDDVIAFLESLTDQEFIDDPQLSNPLPEPGN
jgi:cytochrome c peroxidase